MAASGGFKKRSARKNIRERKKNEDFDDDETTNNVTSKVTPTPADEAPPIKSKGVLSFEDEVEEGEVFKIKKSSRSEKYTREKERQSSKKEKEKKQEIVVVNTEDDDLDTEDTVHINPGVVPDAITIHAIRKKRQLARGMGVASVDYIPLEQGGKRDFGGTVKGKSRLVREDENDKSDDSSEDGGVSGHMTFGKKDGPGKQLQVLTALENVDSESEDEETRLWEEEQINKGIKTSNPQISPTREELTINSLDPLTQSYIHGITATSSHYDMSLYHDTKPFVRPLRRVPVNFVPVTMETVKSKLQNSLQELSDSLNNHEKQLEQADRDKTESLEFIKISETEYPLIESRYLFFQQMRGYLQDLLSCLAVKAPVIKTLEAKIQNVRQRESKLLIDRRRQDVLDESKECTAAAATSDGGGEGERRAVEREGRRRRRRGKREKEVVLAHDEGMSSDDEILESDRLQFINEIESLTDNIKEIFEDVVDDFINLEVIKTRFEQWRSLQLESYKQAYVSICLPKIFVPFVRYEMLHWNPLTFSTVPIESMKWFQSLLFYCYQEGIDPDPSDDDVHLIPQIIDRVIVSKLTSIIQYVWDPLSSSQTQNLINNIKHVIEEFPTIESETKNIKQLKMSLVKKFQDSLNEDIFIPLMTKSQLESTNTKSYHFYQRQFWKCMKLLGNILYCEGLLPDDVLQQLVLDGLVSRHLLLSLQNSPVDDLTVRKIATLLKQLPHQWLTTGNSNKTIQSIKRYLCHLQETLQREEMSCTNEQIKKYIRRLENTLLELRTLLVSS